MVECILLNDLGEEYQKDGIIGGKLLASSDRVLYHPQTIVLGDSLQIQVGGYKK